MRQNIVTGEKIIQFHYHSLDTRKLAQGRLEINTGTEQYIHIKLLNFKRRQQWILTIVQKAQK